MEWTLQDLVWFMEHYRELERIARSLHRYYTLRCNGDLTARQEKREGKLEEQAKEIIQQINKVLGAEFEIYFQTDPRGLPLWIIDKTCYIDYPNLNEPYLAYNRGMPVLI